MQTLTYRRTYLEHVGHAVIGLSLVSWLKLEGYDKTRTGGV